MTVRDLVTASLREARRGAVLAGYVVATMAMAEQQWSKAAAFGVAILVAR